MHDLWRYVLKQFIYLFVDFPDHDSPIKNLVSIQAIKKNKSGLYEKFNTSFLDDGVQRGTEAFSFIKSYLDLLEFLEDKIIISHYKHFEREFIMNKVMQNHVMFFNNDWLDMQEIMLEQYGFGGTVDEAIQYLNIASQTSKANSFVPFKIKDIHQRAYH